MEIRDQFIAEIAKEICLYCNHPIEDDYGTVQNCSLNDTDRPCKASLTTAKVILDLKTVTHRLAVVKVKGKLPENPEDRDGHDDGRQWFAYKNAQNDMLEAHYVQESSEEATDE